MSAHTHMHITIAVPLAEWEAFDDWLTEQDMPYDSDATIIDYQYGDGEGREYSVYG